MFLLHFCRYIIEFLESNNKNVSSTHTRTRCHYHGSFRWHMKMVFKVNGREKVFSSKSLLIFFMGHIAVKFLFNAMEKRISRTISLFSNFLTKEEEVEKKARHSSIVVDVIFPKIYGFLFYETN